MVSSNSMAHGLHAIAVCYLTIYLLLLVDGWPNLTGVLRQPGLICIGFGVCLIQQMEFPLGCDLDGMVQKVTYLLVGVSVKDIICD